jgi:hypothetical protein
MQVVASLNENFKENFSGETRASRTPDVCEETILGPNTLSGAHSTCERIVLPMESAQAAHSRTIDSGETSTSTPNVCETTVGPNTLSSAHPTCKRIVLSTMESAQEATQSRTIDNGETRASTHNVNKANVRPNTLRTPHSTCERIVLPMESAQATHSRTIVQTEDATMASLTELCCAVISLATPCTLQGLKIEARRKEAFVVKL